MGLQFEWDSEKAAANLKKHRVSFEEAETVFGDPGEMTVFDEDHSEEEDRYISMGISNLGRVLVVSYTDREDRIRIISARVANKTERKLYEEAK
jgi:uncharacterized protein